MASGRKVAILQTAFLGDTLLSIPLVKALLQHEVQRDAILLICRKGLGEFFGALDLFDQVLEVEKGNASSYRQAMQELESWWDSASSRILLSPHESPRSRIWAARLRMRGMLRSAMGAKKDVQVIGFRTQPFGVLSAANSHSVTRPMELPEALRQLALLQADVFASAEIWRERLRGFRLDQSAGKGGVSASGKLMEVPEWASMALPRFTNLKRDQNRVVLAPGSVWKTKQWTKEGFAQVGREAVLKGFTIELVGTKDERPLCEEIVNLLLESLRLENSSLNKDDLNSRVLNHAGQCSLLQTSEILAAARRAFVNDSGAMHLAALGDTPTVAFFGPTVLDFGYRPWSNRAIVLEPTEPLKCRPCGKHGGEKCPIGTHECMKSIRPERATSFF